MNNLRTHTLSTWVTYGYGTPQYRGEKRGSLTTEHAASSYGLPVFVLEGQAHGPDDLPADAVLHIDEYATVGAQEAMLQAARQAGFRIDDSLYSMFAGEDGRHLGAPRWQV